MGGCKGKVYKARRKGEGNYDSKIERSLLIDVPRTVISGERRQEIRDQINSSKATYFSKKPFKGESGIGMDIQTVSDEEQDRIMGCLIKRADCKNFLEKVSLAYDGFAKGKRSQIYFFVSDGGNYIDIDFESASRYDSVRVSVPKGLRNEKNLEVFTEDYLVNKKGARRAITDRDLF